MSFTMLIVILPKYVVPFGSGAFNAPILTQFQPEEKRDFEEGSVLPRILLRSREPACSVGAHGVRPYIKICELDASFEEGLPPGAYFKFVHTLAVDFSF